jgi:4-nitrophenyl phosphatase
MIPLESIRNLIIDMDGVLWHGERPMPGLLQFFATLRRKGIGIVLATNNASRSGQAYVDKLAGMGVQVGLHEVLTSPQATAAYLAAKAPDARIFVIGEQGLKVELAARSLSLVEDENTAGATHVVVGIDRTLTYAKLVEACLLIRSGATFIGTNPDVTFPGERGIVPGNGATLAALQAATGIAPQIIGKPQPEMMLQALARLGGTAADTAVIGDRLDTDILGGQRAGLSTLLVLSGISDADENARGPVTADYVFADIGEIAQRLDG